VIAVNTDGVTAGSRGLGSASNIDVSGDSVQGNLQVGMVPAYAGLTPDGTKLYVANSGDDTVTANTTSSPTAAAVSVSLPPTPSAQITSVAGDGTTATYTYSGTLPVSPGDTVFVTGCATPGFNGVFTVSSAAAGSFQAPNSTASADNPESPNAVAKMPNAVFASSADNNNMYVAGYSTATPGVGAVYIINSSNAISAAVPVGTHPVAISELPNLRAVYVANQGSGTVSVIDTVNPTEPQPPIALGAGAVWVAAKSDSSRVYALDQNGAIYNIDPVTNLSMCNPVLSNPGSAPLCPSPAGAGSNFLLFDPVLNRLYVTNPTNGEVAILDASQDPPVVLNTINISSLCSGCAPDSVTALGDGSRAYVAAYELLPGCLDPSGNPVNCVQTFVAVIDGPSATLKSVVPPPPLAINGVSVNGSEASYSYLLGSTPGPAIGNNVVITGMSNPANNGTFVVEQVTTGAFTVSNPAAAGASNENGAGTVLGAALGSTGCGPAAGSPPAVWQPGTARFRASAISSGGGTNSNFKVYLGQCDAGSIAVLDTFPVNGNPADTYSGVSLWPRLSPFPPLTLAHAPTQEPVHETPGP